MDFQEALLSIYRSKPCQVLPNALWKTLDLVDEMNTNLESRDGIDKLCMGDDESLHIYWTRDRDRFDLKDSYTDNIEFGLVHSDYIDHFPVDNFSEVKRYFRLYHEARDVPDIDLPRGYRLKQVDVEEEADEVSRLISRCYENIKPEEEEVLSWKEYPVFDEDLWVWIEDVDKDRYAGLGIAEFDNTVPEASLEWIQVDPDYHGKGLGKNIVYELLSRVKERVRYVTVGGEYDTENNPKGFYENCGFKGDDIWYVLR